MSSRFDVLYGGDPSEVIGVLEDGRPVDAMELRGALINTMRRIQSLQEEITELREQIGA